MTPPPIDEGKLAMLKTILVYGLIAGVIVAIPMLLQATVLNGHPPLAWAMLIGYATMLIALSTVFIGIKRYRDAELGGVIRFWPALAMGLGISFVASVMYVFAWELTVAVTHMDFANGYANALIKQKQAEGVTGAAMAQFVQEMEKFKTDYANPFFRLPMTFIEIFPVGVLVSLVSAALLRNARFLAARPRAA
jgi:Protein of unknown function (DUF4199)